jgi:proteasome lid subunit RPN8/RPN11
MKPASVIMSKSDRSQLLRHALTASPAECCGLLVGREDDGQLRLTSVHASENLAADKLATFEIDFRIRLHLEDDLAHKPDRIVGLYHSHPDGSPEPSATDLADAAEAGLVWLVLAVDGIGAVDISAWLFQGHPRTAKSFSPLPVLIE